MTADRLVYGFDPLCGWCFGFVPAMRRLVDVLPDLPIELVPGGLVTGERVGPYRDMLPYILRASQRLEEVTGHRPSDAFFERIGRAGTIGSSVEPSIVIQDVIDREGHGTGIGFAHDVIEAHFGDGADLNDRELYGALYARHGIEREVPPFDHAHRERMAKRFADARAAGVDSFPTIIALRDGRSERLPSVYDPSAFVAEVERALGL